MARKRKTKTKIAGSGNQERDVDESAIKNLATDTSTTATAVKITDPSKPSKTSAGNLSKPSVEKENESLLSLVDDLLPTEPGMEHLSTARVLLVGSALLTVGTIGFYNIPGLIDKDIDSSSTRAGHLVNSFYCACITLTTVGFGDICPGDTNAEGKLFLLLFSLAGLGFFCGPIVQLGAAWRHAIPGGLTALATFVLGLGVTIFTTVEGLDHVEAMYASIITGTTIGYGDITPKSDAGKIAIALYAIVSVHAVGILLDPARTYLEQLCQRPKRKLVSSVKKKSAVKQE